MVSTTLRETSFLCGVMGLHDETYRVPSASLSGVLRGYRSSDLWQFTVPRVLWMDQLVMTDTNHIRSFSVGGVTCLQENMSLPNPAHIVDFWSKAIAVGIVKKEPGVYADSILPRWIRMTGDRL